MLSSLTSPTNMWSNLQEKKIDSFFSPSDLTSLITFTYSALILMFGPMFELPQISYRLDIFSEALWTDNLIQYNFIFPKSLFLDIPLPP